VSGSYDPLAVRAVLIAFAQSEMALKARHGSPELSDDVRLRVADEILNLVEGGERNPQRITDAVMAKFAARPANEQA
jgi:hypothetical protein